MAARERILFLTGKLAHDALCRELEQLKDRDFDYRVHPLGLSVAALMTAEMIGRRLADTGDADRIIVPGLCRGDLAPLVERYGIPVDKGPIDLKDLPEYFGGQSTPPDLSDYRVRIFAEIVEAPELEVAGILARAAAYRADGADVIDLGCLPETPFPHLEDAVRALKAAGHAVSVDSLETDDLLRGGRAGADYLLSLKESTLWIADEVAAVPVLIPEQSGDMESLIRAVEGMRARGRDFLADPILDPIPFGFTEAIVRYHALRQRLPDAPILFGTGNLTELTDADTPGMTALLLGIAAELDVAAILTTQVSSHARSVVRESDRARRIMAAARRDNRLPRRIDPGLMALHERKPFPYSAEEIAANAQAIKDPSFRIQLSSEGIHIYNRDGLHTATDPFDLYPHLGVEQDGGHAFYLGVELGRAQIAWQLGKRYHQDRELGWGCVVPRPEDDQSTYTEAGTTLKARRKSS
jgi:dihydropteroate synthase-like protein